MGKFVVEFYEKSKGCFPAEEFLLSLDMKMAAKMYAIIEVLEEKGNFLREPYSKHIEDGIFEIRGKVGSDISRVLYFFYYGGRIILTNGFRKKSDKLPLGELKKAKAYRKEFLERMENQDEKL